VRQGAEDWRHGRKIGDRGRETRKRNVRQGKDTGYMEQRHKTALNRFNRWLRQRGNVFCVHSANAEMFKIAKLNKSFVTGYGDHKNLVSAKIGKKIFHACVPLTYYL
jgi:hypothetical protein